MSTFTFKIHGRNVKFKAASTTQALFARDHHLTHLRDKAKERAKIKRIQRLAVAKHIGARIKREMDNHLARIENPGQHLKAQARQVEIRAANQLKDLGVLAS